MQANGPSQREFSRHHHCLSRELSDHSDNFSTFSNTLQTFLQSTITHHNQNTKRLTRPEGGGRRRALGAPTEHDASSFLSRTRWLARRIGSVLSPPRGPSSGRRANSEMKLRRFLLRYYPPGIILEYEQGGELKNKPVDLLTLTPESDVEVLVNQVVRQEQLISENRKPQVAPAPAHRPAPLAARPPAHPPRTRLTDPPARAAAPQLRKLIYKLIEKIESHESQNFYLFKILRAHILPLTNCAFNKSGDRFITGSYDRTCKVWNTLTGEELLTLEGHKNVVYAIAFNNP